MTGEIYYITGHTKYPKKSDYRGIIYADDFGQHKVEVISKQTWYMANCDQSMYWYLDVR